MKRHLTLCPGGLADVLGPNRERALALHCLVDAPGRDANVLVWYVGRRVPPNLAHLEARMRQSGGWSLETPLDAHNLRDRLEERFGSIRFDQTKEDIAPFLKDPSELSLCPKDSLWT